MADGRTWRVRKPGGDVIGPYDLPTLRKMVVSRTVYPDWVARDNEGKMVKVRDVITDRKTHDRRTVGSDGVSERRARSEVGEANTVVETTHRAAGCLDAWAWLLGAVGVIGLVVGLVGLSEDRILGMGLLIPGGIAFVCGLFAYAVLHGASALLSCAAEILDTLNKDEASHRGGGQESSGPDSPRKARSG